MTSECRRDRRALKIARHLVESPTAPIARNLASSTPKTYEDVKHMTVEQLRNQFGRPDPNGVKIEGVNHVAWVSSDMAKTVWFWSHCLGVRLVKTVQVGDDGQHFFLEGGGTGPNGKPFSIAYFWFPDAPKPVPGVATVDFKKMIKTGSFATAHGSVNHVAFNCERSKLEEYRQRIIDTKMSVVTPMLYHTDEPGGYGDPDGDAEITWASFYFTGPDGEYLELACQTDRMFSPERDILHVPNGRVEDM